MPSLEELHRENAQLRVRVRELEETLDEPIATLQAIKAGLVDAVVVDRDEVPEVLTLESAEEMYLRLAQQAAKVGTWDWDLETGELRGSPSFWFLFGETGRSRIDFREWSSPSASEDRQQFVRSLQDSCENGGAFARELWVVGESGETRWLDTRGCTLRAANGAASRLVGICLDITERKNSEEALRLVDRHRTEFLATLAHELRNPLAPIRSSLDVLRLSPTDPNRVDLLAMIDRQVDNLVRLVDDLLEVSRISSGKIVLDKQLIDIDSVIKMAVETSQPLMDAAGHKLTVSLPPGRITVEADPLRLSQIIANLLNNAAKYTDRNGQIWLTVSDDKDHLQISVRDNGVGIASEMLPHVFGMFSQLDRDHKRAQGGLGIGLALVKALVKLHDGSIEARSSGLGRGSEFLVKLPHTRRSKEVEIADNTTGSGAEPTSVNRILVVDDNADAASALALLLETLGHKVQVAHNGSAALARLDDYRPNILFLDLGMPGMSGYEVAQKMRENPAYDNVMLIALTGWGQDEDCRRSNEAGFSYHLVKPIRLSTVKDILSKVQP